MRILCKHKYFIIILFGDRETVFTFMAAWFMTKNSPHFEVLNKEVMKQAAFGLMNNPLKKGSGIFSPHPTPSEGINISLTVSYLSTFLWTGCPRIPSIEAFCPTLVEIVKSGYMKRDAKQQGGTLNALSLGHFRQVRIVLIFIHNT